MFNKSFLFFLFTFLVFCGIAIFYYKSFELIEKQSIAFEKHDNEGSKLYAQNTKSSELVFLELSKNVTKSQQSYFLWGVLFGLSILIFFINLFYFFSTIDPLFLRFGIYILAVLIGQVLYSDLVFDFLFLEKIVLNESRILAVYFCFYVLVVFYFHQLLIDHKYFSAKINWGNNAVKILYILALAFYLFLPFFELKSENYVLQIFAFYLFKILLFIFVFVSIVLIYNGLNSDIKWKKIFYFGYLFQLVLLLLLLFKIGKSVDFQYLVYLNEVTIIVLIYLIDIFIFCYLLVFRYKNIANESNLLSLKLAENKYEINSKIIKVLDTERKQVSQILNKNVNSKIVNALFFLQTLEHSEVKSELIKMLKGLNCSFLQITNNIFISDDLQSDIGEKIKNWVYKLNLSQSIHFEYLFNGPKVHLNTTTEKEFFSIINELTTNILKHSHATKASIAIETIGKTFKVKIIDNGVGFDITKAQNGIGLLNIHKRVIELNSILIINSDKKGTQIVVEMVL